MTIERRGFDYLTISQPIDADVSGIHICLETYERDGWKFLYAVRDFDAFSIGISGAGQNSFPT